MHDSILMQRMSSYIKKMCIENKIGKVTKMLIVLSVEDSGINSEIIKQHLVDMNAENIDVSTDIEVRHEEILKNTAIIQFIEGEGIEKC